MRPRRATYWFPENPRHAALLAFVVSMVCGLTCAALGISGSGFYDGYMALGDSLAHGVGYRFSAEEPLVLHRPPVYPVMLAPIALLPESAWKPAIVLMQSLIVAGTAWGVFAIARRWFGPVVAGWAALALTTNPWLLASIHTTRTAFPEMLLYLVAGGWFVAWMLRADQEEVAWRQALLFGLLWGVLTLTHSAKLLSCGMLVGLLALSCAWRGQWRAAAVTLVVSVAALAVTIAPWTWRNYQVTGKFLPVGTNAGYSYFAGDAHWGVTGSMEQPGEEWPQAALRHAGVDAPARDIGRFWGLYTIELNEQIDRRMSEHVRENPGEFAFKVAANALEFYFPVVHPIYAKAHGDDRSSWRQALLNGRTIGLAAASAYYAALWIAAVAGFRAGPAAGDPRAAWLLLAVIAAYVAPYLPFLVKAGFAGYTLPTAPLLAILAARARASWPAPNAARMV